MSQASLSVRSKFQQQIQRFLVTGVSAVLVDTLFYFLLIQVISTSLSKMISFLCGTILAYILNKFWTFKKKAKSHIELFQYMGLYLSTLGINVASNMLFLTLTSNKIIAFVFATGISASLNFIGQKWWVFKE
ncbi:GtrA family protein [Halobacillus halophilus]|uniref:GtrA family protein n=1 Tax=Halobacillus halophilus TaxID=1570 RepID=UPI001CD43067|nr:GtrA family protein [Halobacillus halophilus]MCA1010079.1 GtrA family protein [Halobacillus halophilus]